MRKKVFADGNLLSYDIEAVHKKSKQKHTIEKESSMRIHKVKIPHTGDTESLDRCG